MTNPNNVILWRDDKAVFWHGGKQWQAGEASRHTGHSPESYWWFSSPGETERRFFVEGPVNVNIVELRRMLDAAEPVGP